MASRGDIYFVDLEPTKGREIQKGRPVLVISPTKFNRFNLPLIAPITGGAVVAREGLMTISLSGLGLRTDGVVLCNQLRTVDLTARKARFVEKVDDETMSAILERIADIFEFEGGRK